MNSTIKQAMKKEDNWIKFLQDVAKVMQKHKINDAVIIGSCNEQLRNSYLALDGEKELYCHVSDAFNEWLKQGEKN